MDIVSGIVVYVLLWWFVFFMALPIGVRVPDQPGEGHATSAPANPLILKKVIAATFIAVALWFVVWGLIEADLYSFRESVKGPF
jgi:predicted secreted protein